MCGISGVIYKKNVNRNYIYDIYQMNELIEHRGPDNTQIYEGEKFIFGHNRLSIIDLSNSGNQPMVFENKYVITYNGEIYNFKNLRIELEKKGYKFKSTSDTEVLLKGYVEWKEKILEKINGMFSFAIYDIEKKKCFLARDRYGIKPLYYYSNSKEFYFFSEPKQVIMSNIAPAIPDKDSVKEYLSFQFTLSSKTLFENIFKVEPGHYIEINENLEIKINKYWDLEEIKIDKNISYRSASKNIRQLINEAVELRMISDVKIGSYLSGGIDSSIVSSIASSKTDELNTYTFTSKGSKTDESEIAKLTSEKIYSSHNESQLDIENILENWINGIYFMDEPEVGYSLIPQMKISEKVSQKLKVVLGGQGGDEIFFGYGWHTILYTSLLNKLNDVTFVDKINLIFNFIFKLKIYDSIKLIKNIILNLRKKIDDLYFEFWTSNGLYEFIEDDKLKEKFKQKLKFDKSIHSFRKFEIKYWLQGILHVEDRSSMYVSLESRVPLLDYRIGEYTSKLKPSYFFNGVLNKKVLIDSHRDLLIKKVINNKKKKGYSSPINEWFKEPEIKKFIKDIVTNKDSYIYSFVNFDNKEKFNNRQLWMLISLEIWHKIFITNEINPTNAKNFISN